MIDVFLYDDYKAYLRAVLTDRERKVTVSKMADAAHCQRPYLSKVLNAEIHLTPDHAHGISRFLGLPSKAHHYFMTLVHYERAGLPDYRAQLKSELAALRKEHQDIANKVKAEIIRTGEEMTFYYSSWVWVAVHVATSVPSLRTTSALARRLRLTEEETLGILEQLMERGFVVRQGDTWTMSDQELHLHKSSPLIGIHHQNWRQRAILSSQFRRSDNIHYTTVSSISLRDREKLKSLFLEFIETTRKMIAASPEEDLVCVNIDCFDV